MAKEISARLADEHEAFSAYLISLFKPKDAKEFDDTIAKLSSKEINDLYKQFKTMEGITFAKMGAKLDYLQRLNGKCPEGYEIEKYMAGGCVKCKKKLLKNTPLMDKCGGKIKKRIKKAEDGDKVEDRNKSVSLSNKEHMDSLNNARKTLSNNRIPDRNKEYPVKPYLQSKIEQSLKKRIFRKGDAIKPIQGGPGMSDSTRGAKLNPKQSKATNGKKRI